MARLQALDYLVLRYTIYDIRFFGESGYVSSSFSKRRLIAEAITAWILPKLVGLDTAFDILYSSRRIAVKKLTK